MIHKVYKIIYPIGTIRFRHTKNRPGYYKKVQARGIPADWQLIKPATEPNQQELDELIAQNKKDTLGKKTVADIGKEHYQKIEDRYNNDPEFSHYVNSLLDILTEKNLKDAFADPASRYRFRDAAEALRDTIYNTMGLNSKDKDFLYKLEHDWSQSSVSSNVVGIMMFINKELGRDRLYGLDTDAKKYFSYHADINNPNVVDSFYSPLLDDNINVAMSRSKELIRAQIAYSRFVHNKLFPKGVKVYRGIQGDQAHDITSSLKTNGVAYVDNRPLSSASLTKDVADDFANTRKAIVVSKLIDPNNIFMSVYTSKLCDGEYEFVTMQGRFKFKDKSSIVSSKNFKKVKELGGSGNNWLGKNKDGKLYVVKEPRNIDTGKEQLKKEVYADYIYTMCDVDVPDSHIDNTGAKISNYIHAENNLSDIILDNKEVYKVVKKQIAKQFIIDAWLANWDVIGQDFDNILVNNSYTPYRIDNGSCFDMRAQGGKKKFSSNVDEIDSMRDPNINANTYEIYGDLTDEDLSNQFNRHKRAMKFAIEWLRARDKKLADILEKRYFYLENRFGEEY